MNISRTHQTHATGAFTLLEIMIAISIVVMVATASIYSGATMMRRGRVASVVTAMDQAKASIATFLSEPNSVGSLPITYGSIPDVWFTGTGTTFTNVAAAASLDQVFLAEGITDKPFAVAMGTQITTPTGTVGVNWDTTLKKFTATAAPNVNKDNIAHLESTIVTSWPWLPFTCRPDGVSTLTLGATIAYMQIPNVPIRDAQALSLAVDKSALSISDPTLDDHVGSVCYTTPTADGLTNVFVILGGY